MMPSFKVTCMKKRGDREIDKNMFHINDKSQMKIHPWERYGTPTDRSIKLKEIQMTR